MRLRCLSIRQPWAWLILHAWKDVENRSWPLRERGTVLLHAAKGMTRQEYEDAAAFCPNGTRPIAPMEALERGGIVGAANLIGQWLPHEHRTSPWHIHGQYGFRLANVTRLPFRPLKGMLGFFAVDATDDEQLVLREAGLLPARVMQRRP